MIFIRDLPGFAVKNVGMNIYWLFPVNAGSFAPPGASIAVQMYGYFLNFNPHLHAIVSDGCFITNGSFSVAPKFMVTDLNRVFQHEVLKMLKKAGKINDAIIENMLSWHHSGFNVYIGDRIYPQDKTSLGNLARYIVRACFLQERMIYMADKDSDDGIAKVVYAAKDKKSRQNWARLILKVYEVDPLLCPKCQGTMKIISSIEDLDIIEKILRHLELWDTRNIEDPKMQLKAVLRQALETTYDVRKDLLVVYRETRVLPRKFLKII